MQAGENKKCLKFYILVLICAIPVIMGLIDTCSVKARKYPVCSSGLEWTKTMIFVGAAVVHLKWFIDTCTQEENEKKIRACIHSWISGAILIGLFVAHFHMVLYLKNYRPALYFIM